jgi:hypothetical protein
MNESRGVSLAEFDSPMSGKPIGHRSFRLEPVDRSFARSLAHVGKQGHEPSPLDGSRDCMLADRSATRLAAPYNPTVAIDQLPQSLNVLVIDKHRTWALAIDKEWISPFGFGTYTRSFSGTALGRRRPTHSGHVNSSS